MSDSLKNKLNNLLGKFDNKMLTTKINNIVEMLNNGKTDELAKKFNKVDTNELLEKLEEFDSAKLDELNINKEDLLNKINSSDLDSLSSKLGDNGKEIMNKIKNILSQKQI
jgi:uncharacterized protein YidB (DUF937 family)